MIYTNLKKNHMYVNQASIPFPKGTPIGRGNIIFLCTSSMVDSLDVLADEKFNLTNFSYTRYMINEKYKTKIGTKNIIENQTLNFKDIFNNRDISSLYAYIPNLQKSAVIKKKSNLIIDLGYWNQLYFSYRRKMVKVNDINNDYINFLADKLNKSELNIYKKILLIPVNYWLKKPNISFGVTKEYLNNPISILVSSLKNSPELLEKLKNIDIYLCDSNGSIMLLDPSNIINISYVKLKTELMKNPSLKEISDDKEIENELKSEYNNDRENVSKDVLSINDIKNPEVSNIVYQVSNDDQSNDDFTEEDVDAIMSSDETLDENNDEEDTEIEDNNSDTEEDVETEKTIKNNLFISKFRPEFSVDDKNRIKILQKKQNDILSQSISEMKSKTIEQSNYNGVINTTNKTILEPKAKNFTKSYNEKKLESDIDNAIAALSTTDFPIYIVSKSVEDTSDTLNAKKTYTYVLEDHKGNKFTTKFDMPIIIDERYIYLNGIKSVIQNQLIPFPIIKSGPNEVQIIGQYNKIYLRRKETDRLDTKSQIVKKYFLDINNSSKYRVKIGNCLIKNKEFDTPLDFDNLSKNISEITIGKNKFIFDIPKLLEYINDDREKNNKKPFVIPYTDDNKLIVGYNIQTKDLILIDEAKGESITDKIMNEMTKDELDKLLRIKPGGNKYTYIKAKMLDAEVPIIFFMLYCEGLTKVLEKIGVKYTINEPGTNYDSLNKGCIKTKDKWIIWDKYPFHNSLLLNGMILLPTEDFAFEELDSKSSYIDMTPIFFKDIKKSFVLDQFKDFLLDPISKEILKDMNMPTDLNELLVTAAIMLNNNKFDSILDMKNIRIRNNEIFAQFVYKAFADAYLPYRKSMYKKRPDKLSVNRYLVTTNINGSAKTKQAGCKLIEGASSLNPILELEKQGAISYRGPSGINRSDAYTLSKRAFNPSMTGIIGISSSPDANVGIQRQLTLDPNIKSTRGYLEAANSENIKDMTSAELFTPAELLSPPGVMHDDGQRTAMAYKQSKYMVLTDGMTPVMIGNKVESAVPYYLSREFVITAQNDGKVIAIENNIVVVEYKNGIRDSFSLDPVQQKNSAGGFYIETKFVTDLKLGDSFKKNQILAYNPNAFTRNKDDLSASMNIGVLCKVAIAPTYDEYEDSAPITKIAAEKLATTITMEQSFIIGANARVDSIAKVGDHINVGDPLAIFEDWQDDPETASWLNDMAEIMGEDVSSHVATRKASEYAGEIADVKFYSASDLDELSPSLRPYVEEYWKKIKAKNKVLEKYQNEGDFKTLKCGQLITEKAGKTEAKNGKIFGRDITDGVLVRFFIKHKDVVKKGDKLTNYTALKGIVSNVIDEGFEPYSEYRKDEPIDILMAPGAILARKTPSAILSMFGNKVLIELKRQVKDIYNK